MLLPGRHCESKVFVRSFSGLILLMSPTNVVDTFWCLRWSCSWAALAAHVQIQPRSAKARLPGECNSTQLHVHVLMLLVSAVAVKGVIRSL